jgi:S-DNA-T family DNA segregation ATPase FtsK/SpoIIIE
MRHLFFILLGKLYLLWGTVLFGIGIYLACAFASYNPLDPSFNRVGGDEIANLTGIYGAYIADPLLQLFGVSVIFLCLAPMMWGLRIIAGGTVTKWPIRILALFVCLLTSSILFSTVSTAEKWLFTSFGGFVGLLIKHYLYNIQPSLLLIRAISCAILLLSFIIAIGGKGENGKVIFIKIYNIALQVYKLFKCVGVIFAQAFKMLFYKSKAEQPSIIPPQISIKQHIKASFSKSRPAKKKLTIIHNEDGYQLPPLALLNQIQDKPKKLTGSEANLTNNATKLEHVLADFGVFGKITDIHPGPVVTLYELEPAAGTKSSRVIGLADDIARSMSAVSARIAVIPGRNAIGIELPNHYREIVYLRELLEAREYNNEDYKLPIVLGKDIGGRPIIVDLAKMPHLLVAGTTGSGKSVAINTMVLSLVYRLTPADCKFIMIDPKMLELSVYDGIPHLLTPVVTEPKKAIVALKWVVKEMENRYRLMSTLGVRNIAGYNKRIEEAKLKGETLERNLQTGFDPETGKPIIEKLPIELVCLPFIVVIVDEMADLMLVAGKDIESSIQRLSQMARAAGIHIIMATQRPSVDVITGVIKANFPTRISFQVTSRIDSRTILGEQGGAEQLLGMGDMLYMAGGSRIIRVHGPFVDDKEVEKIVSYLKSQSQPDYIEDVTISEDSFEDEAVSEDGDDLYNEAVMIIARDRKASTSYIQRCLKIGYNRAASIIERMEKEGLIGAANHVGKREVLMPERRG